MLYFCWCTDPDKPSKTRHLLSLSMLRFSSVFWELYIFVWSTTFLFWLMLTAALTAGSNNKTQIPLNTTCSAPNSRRIKSAIITGWHFTHSVHLQNTNQSVFLHFNSFSSLCLPAMTGLLMLFFFPSACGCVIMMTHPGDTYCSENYHRGRCFYLLYICL